jgi:excisionase family DNA binding protein
MSNKVKKSAVADAPGNAVSPPEGERRPFCTTAELQKILPLSRRTIFEWRKKGIIPSVQIGAKVLFHAASVEAALLRHQVGNGANH